MEDREWAAMLDVAGGRATNEDDAGEKAATKTAPPLVNPMTVAAAQAAAMVG